MDTSYRQKRCAHGWVRVDDCPTCVVQIKVEELERENARLQKQVDDLHIARAEAEDEASALRCALARLMDVISGLRSVLDPDRIISKCVPGGDICDPQVVADNIRDYISANDQGDSQPPDEKL